MHLAHIGLDQLSVSQANMRAGKKPPDLDDLLPSVRQRGVLVPLLVRKGEADGAFEIVAGRRRFHAARLAAEEGGPDRLPCAILEEGDDASALEASILENVARDDPHEVEQWVSFNRLVREGRSAEEIAIMFGLTAKQVAQVLALGNLAPKIRDLYRAGELDAGTVRLLTMASKTQQKEWLAIYADKDRFTPMGQSLKSWLFGGASIPTANAIFDLETYPGAIVTDLFGEGGYFADAGQFWAAQRTAIEAKRQALIDAGWADAILLEPGQYFSSWDYERVPKSKGGKVFITLSQRGEVAFHEGYLTRKEARALAKGEGGGEAKPVRAEVTSSLQTYIDLHRHSACRAELLNAPAIALRLMAAHIVAGSPAFFVRPDPQRAGSDAIAESVETSLGETIFDEERRKLLALLGFDAESPHLIQSGQSFGERRVAAVFARLLALDEADVMRVIALVMGEVLEPGSAAVEAAALTLNLDMSAYWQADDAFLSLLRDREVLTAMVGDLAGEDAAAANAKEPVKALKAVVADCLTGSNGRTKVEHWVPRFMAVPPAAYTGRGGVKSVTHHEEIAALLRRSEEAPPEDAWEPVTDDGEAADVACEKVAQAA